MTKMITEGPSVLADPLHVGSGMQHNGHLTSPLLNTGMDPVQGLSFNRVCRQQQECCLHSRYSYQFTLEFI